MAEAGPTLPVQKPSRPALVQALPGSDGSAIVFFKKPNANRARITNYQARCTSGNGGVVRQVRGMPEAGPMPMLRVKGLTKGKTYRCSVRAFNRLGWGLPTWSTPFKAGGIAPPGPPDGELPPGSTAVRIKTPFTKPMTAGTEALRTQAAMEPHWYYWNTDTTPSPMYGDCYEYATWVSADNIIQPYIWFDFNNDCMWESHFRSTNGDYQFEEYWFGLAGDGNWNILLQGDMRWDNQNGQGRWGQISGPYDTWWASAGWFRSTLGGSSPNTALPGGAFYNLMVTLTEHITGY